MDRKFHKEIPFPSPLQVNGAAARLKKITKLTDEIKEILSVIDTKKILYILQLKESLDSLSMHTKGLTYSCACKLLKEGQGDLNKEKITSYMQGLRAIEKVSQEHPLNIALMEKINLYVERGHGKIKGEPGHLRKKQNWIGKKGCCIEEALHYPPAPEKVAPLLKKLLSFMHSDHHPVVICAVFFGYFLDIHPFMDGNGRTVRIVISGVFKQNNILPHAILFLSRYFHIYRQKYLQSLYKLRIARDWNEWIRFFTKGMEYELVLLKYNLGKLKKVNDNLDFLLHDMKDAKRKKIKDFLFTHPYFTTQEWKTLDLLHECADSRILNLLIDASIVMRVKRGCFEVKVLKKIGSKKISLG
jgi:hypothetical protein